MNGSTGQSSIDFQLQQIERIPVFGPYLSLMAAAHLTLADALGLANLRTALYVAPPSSGAPADQPSAMPAGLPANQLPEPADTLRQAA